MDRRDFIKASSACIAAGASGLSGCLRFQDIVSGGGSMSGITGWLPEPGALDSDLSHYPVTARSPAQLSDVSDDFLWDINVAPDVEFGNPLAEEVEYIISMNTERQAGSQFVVYVGDFDSEWSEEILLDKAYERARSFGDYTLIEHEQEPRAYAVSDDAVVHGIDAGGEEPDPISVAQTVVDANEEEVTRYTGSNEDMDALTGELAAGPRVSIETYDRFESTEAEAGRFESNVGRGTSYQVNGKETDVTNAYVYLSEGDVVERDLNTYIDESGRFTNYRSPPELTINGRTAVIEGTIPTRMVQWF
jgi:hypothetical protein